MPLTQGLSELIERKPVEADDLRAAALFTLDAIANAIAGRDSIPGEKLLRWGEDNGDDPGRHAFLFGALTHILEMDDLHRASVVHPGCVVVPAAHAVARRRRASGRAMLRAVLHGYEAACRVGTAVGPAHYRIWHNTASCGPYGSAAAAASLLGLDREGWVNALGNAGAQSFGLWEFMESAAMTKHLHAGRAAESGVIAAELAAQGFTGPPKILEGKRGFFAAMCPDADPRKVLEDPDAPWQLRRSSIKPWNCCRHTHPAIDAALSLGATIEGEAIDAIRVGTYQAALDVCDRPEPQNEYAAKFSLQHTVAAALTDARIDFESFTPESRGRATALRDRVELFVSPAIESRYPEAWGAELEVRTSNGKTLRARSDHAKGDPEAPLDEADMVAKAELLMRRGGVAEPSELIATVLAMAEDGEVPALDLRRLGNR